MHDQVTEVVKNIQKYLKYSMVIKTVDCGISRPESKHQHFLAVLSYSKPWLLNRERGIMIQALWSTNMLCFFFKKSLLDLLQYCFCLTFFGVFLPWGMWDLSFLARDWTHAPYTGRWSLNHWTSREVPMCWIFVNFFFWPPFIACGKVPDQDRTRAPCSGSAES